MLTRVKCGLIMQIFCCGFTGKMRTRLQIFYVLFILQRQAYCLRLKTVRGSGYWCSISSLGSAGNRIKILWSYHRVASHYLNSTVTLEN